MARTPSSEKQGGTPQVEGEAGDRKPAQVAGEAGDRKPAQATGEAGDRNPDQSRRSVLVTGASGFAGRHLLGALEAAGWDVLALVRDEASWEAMPWVADLQRTETVVGGITEPGTWSDDPRLDGLDGIIHLAALVKHSRRDTDVLYETNVRGSLNMFDLAARTGARLIHMSTSGVVGCFTDPHSVADEESPYCGDRIGTWPYYDSKMKAERSILERAQGQDVSVVIFRAPVLLGPRDHRLHSTRHILKAMKRRLPFVVEGGIHFVDIRDVSEAMVCALELDHPRPIYHLAGTACGITDFFRMVEEISGVPGPPFTLPYGPAWVIARLLEGRGWVPDPVTIEMATHHWGLESLYAKDDLGFQSRDGYTTLVDTVDWLREAGHAPSA